MATRPAGHPLEDRCRKITDRHKHDYTPPPDCARRCTCGHTKWKLAVGGLLPPAVTCAQCGSNNRTATQYERGYETGLARPTAALGDTP